MSKDRVRLDKYLAVNNFFESREKACQAIEAGSVKVNDVIITQTSYELKPTDKVESDIKELKYVSRGGYKLEKAIGELNIILKGKIVLDAGASTGGFTDCALQYGAKKVFAIDVGSDQLHHSMKNHPKVVSRENTDIRNITIKDLDDSQVDIIVADLSFISLNKVFESFYNLLKDDGQLIALVKPQFETTRKIKFKKGIIKSDSVRDDILERVKKDAREHKFMFRQMISTDANKSNKNIEFIALFTKSS